MRFRVDRIWLVQSVSLFRLLAGVLFASLAFQNTPVVLLSGLYGFAVVSDLMDGYLARRLKAETRLGGVLDIVSDKSLTIISVLYAAARGLSLLPLAVVATREMIMMGSRIIIVGGKPLFSTSKLTGGVLSILLWGNTLFLVVLVRNDRLLQIANVVAWAAGLVSFFNLVSRIYVARNRIRAAMKAGA